MALHNPNNWHWIDKDVAEWTREWFGKTLTGISAEDGDVNAKITKVISMDGDANVCQRKGKVITLYDIKLVLEYSGAAPGEEEVSGTITIPEVAHDTEKDEFVFEIGIYSESKGKQAVKDLVRSKIVPQLRNEFPKLPPALIAEHGKDIQHTAGSNPSSGFSTPKYHPPSSKSAEKPGTTTAQHNSSHIVNTTTVEHKAEFMTTAEELYKVFTELGSLQAFFGALPEKFEGAEKGGKFELFDGNVAGEYQELEKPTKIEQLWRFKDWPAGHYSKQVIEFIQDDAHGVTEMRLKWSDVPVGYEGVVESKWKQYYVHSINQRFGGPRF